MQKRLMILAHAFTACVFSFSAGMSAAMEDWVGLVSGAVAVLLIVVTAVDVVMYVPREKKEGE